MSAHDRLLAELRRRCAGPPVLPDELAGANSAAEWKVQRAAIMPLLLGTLRADFVRSLLASVIGITLAIAGSSRAARCPSWVGFAGAGLALWSVLGLPLPGGIPFLPAKTPPGFHCLETERNARLRSIFKAWMVDFVPTPYVRSGEWCTILPFLWTPNKAKNLRYERIWAQNPDDKEHLACDWVFPPGGYDASRPVVLIYTGLAPDAHWTKAGGFVANTAWDLTTHGNITAVVIVSRGTMDTQVKEVVFNGARAQDVREMVLLAEHAMLAASGSEGRSDRRKQLPLFATGFSMGAIMLSGYCGKFGDDTRLAGVVHFSGTYDGIFNKGFEYSDKTWQTYLAYGLKANMLSGRVARIASRRGVDIQKVMSRRVVSVADIDEEFTSVFAGYKGGSDAYYSDMCLGLENKWKRVSIPVLAIYSRDDPITHCDSMHAQELAAGNEHLLFLVTERGGHVGWPWGWRPWQRGFDFMSEGIRVFIEAILSEG